MSNFDFTFENNPCRIPATLGPKPGIVGQHVRAGVKAWLHFNTTLGQTQSGDYAYVKVYAPNRSEKIEDGETFVKVVIKEIVWAYNSIQFNVAILDKDGTEGYEKQIDDPRRLTLV